MQTQISAYDGYIVPFDLIVFTGRSSAARQSRSPTLFTGWRVRVFVSFETGSEFLNLLLLCGNVLGENASLGSESFKRLLE